MTVVDHAGVPVRDRMEPNAPPGSTQREGWTIVGIECADDTIAAALTPINARNAMQHQDGSLSSVDSPTRRPPWTTR